MNEIIIFYSKTPPNKWKLKDFTIKYKEENRNCADNIEVFLKIENNKIINWSFEWVTSIIATATSSVFWESIIWLDLKKILTKDYKYIVELIWEEISPRRKKSSILWLLATRNAIHKYLKNKKKDEFLDLL